MLLGAHVPLIHRVLRLLDVRISELLQERVELFRIFRWSLDASEDFAEICAHGGSAFTSMSMSMSVFHITCRGRRLKEERYEWSDRLVVRFRRTEGWGVGEQVGRERNKLERGLTGPVIAVVEQRDVPSFVQ